MKRDGEEFPDRKRAWRGKQTDFAFFEPPPPPPPPPRPGDPGPAPKSKAPYWIALSILQTGLMVYMIVTTPNQAAQAFFGTFIAFWLIVNPILWLHRDHMEKAEWLLKKSRFTVAEREPRAREAGRQ